MSVFKESLSFEKRAIWLSIIVNPSASNLWHNLGKKDSWSLYDILISFTAWKLFDGSTLISLRSFLVPKLFPVSAI